MSVQHNELMFKHKLFKTCVFFSCSTWQGFTLFPRAAVKSIAAGTSYLYQINTESRMFDLPRLGYASVGSVPTFACVGLLYEYNTDIRLFRAPQPFLGGRCTARGLWKAQASAVLCLVTVYLAVPLCQYDCKFVPVFRW